MNKLSFAISACALLAAAGAHADINFRGFGSIVGGQAVDVDDGGSTMGYTESWDFRRDSLMALQMDADLEDDLTATVQLMSRGSKNWEVDVEWAYLTYAFTDQLQLSAGRIRAPFYRYSDFLDVRYAYNWITAPERVYSFDFPGYDGFSLLYNSSMGPVDSSLQLIAGKMDSDTQGGVPLLFENLVGLSWLGTWEWLTARASYLQADVTIPLGSVESVSSGYEELGTGMLGVAQALGQTAQGYAALAPDFSARVAQYAQSYSLAGTAYLDTVDDVAIEDDLGTYLAFGLSGDYGSFLFDSEWIQYEVEDGMVPTTSAYYIMGGWRVTDPVVIFATYSREEADAPDFVVSPIPDLSLVAASIAQESLLPGEPIDAFGGATLQEAAVGLVQQSTGLSQTLLASKIDVVNMQLGVRWDFHSSAAFKVSYEETDDQVSDVQGSTLRVAIDMVF